ncbi:MAG: transcription antitermination factor NusB [Omnitrophica WOR_2 bacterium RBG_13_44_8]|nr:MAG: transcription antitermination factor NusB [Omnitrophica WOR_2 bacterium RBG_13_44_8]
MNRHLLRKAALDILYQSDLLGMMIEDVMIKETAYRRELIDDYVKRLLLGISSNKEYIDKEIEKYSKNWALDRMSMIDRNILRIAIFEIKFLNDIPYRVSIDEAIELAKNYSSEDAGRFVNGILANYAENQHEGDIE